jgi:CDP-4-dehydro-6-deoxyglucose reductase
MTDWHDIGAAADFSEGTPAAAQAGGTAVALFRLGEEFFALRDLCTHGNARLSEGYVENGCVECPLHQGLFDIRTGAACSAPITEDVRRFPVRLVDGRVEVAVVSSDAPAESAPRSLTARIASLTFPASDVAVIALATSADQPALAYRAGQYVEVCEPGGPRRSYSMATRPGSRQIELHVRHLPGGAFSGRVFDGLATGDELTLQGPHGQFFWRKPNAPVVLLASGTGFAPIQALIEEAIHQSSTRPMRLYWGGRRPADLYRDALCQRWAREFAWFDYVPVISEARPEDNWRGRSGFVHQAVLQDYPTLAGHQVYACGAPIVIESARCDFTAQRGLTPDAFFADVFVSPAAASARQPNTQP